MENNLAEHLLPENENRNGAIRYNTRVRIMSWIAKADSLRFRI